MPGNPETPVRPGSTLGEHLKRLRTARNWSLSELARQSGVAQPTLSRWEQGRFAPRLPELAAVLDALNATPQQRHAVLESLNAPRALVRLAGEIKGMPWWEDAGQMPLGGDLLRAMRMRAGKTLEQAAQMVGVSGSTLSRWERSETWPELSQLHTLCYHLGAMEAEITTLSRGRVFVREADPARFDLEAMIAQLHAVRDDSSPSALILGDLRYLALEAALWPRLKHDEQALPLLYFVLTFRTRFLLDRGRLAESAACAERAFRLEGYLSGGVRGKVFHVSPSPLIFANQHCEAVIAASNLFVKSRVAARRQQGRRLLMQEQALWQRPDYQAWMLSMAADSLHEEGQTDSAVGLSLKAIAVSRTAPNEHEYYNRSRDHAALLVHMQRYAEAQTFLEHAAPLTAISAETRAYHLLLEAECLIGQNQRSEAHSHLCCVETLLHPDELAPLQPRITALQQHC